MNEFDFKRGITYLSVEEAQIVYARCTNPALSTEDMAEKFDIKVDTFRRTLMGIYKALHVPGWHDLSVQTCRWFYEVAGDPPDWDNWPPEYTLPHEEIIAELEQQLVVQGSHYEQIMEDLERQEVISESYKEQLEDYKKQLEEREQTIEELSERIRRLQDEVASTASPPHEPRAAPIETTRSFWDDVLDRELPDIPRPLISLAIFVVIFACIWTVWGLTGIGRPTPTPNPPTQTPPTTPETTSVAAGPSPTPSATGPSIIVTDTPTPGPTFTPSPTPTPFPLPFTDTFDEPELGPAWEVIEGTPELAGTSGDRELTALNDPLFVTIGYDSLSNYAIEFNYRKRYRAGIGIYLTERRFVQRGVGYRWEAFDRDNGWRPFSDTRNLDGDDGHLRFEIWDNGDLVVERNGEEWFYETYDIGPVGEITIQVERSFQIDNFRLDSLPEESYRRD